MNENNYEVGNNTQDAHQSLAIPIAIILGFGLIAIAIFFGGNKNSEIAVSQNGTGDTEKLTNTINPVTEKDYIRGNPNAPIMIVEYSDFDCPFCKVFHETMKQIMAEYGEDGRVAWTYRHFPIISIHPAAAEIAEASECVGSIGGNDAFWQFSDLIFSERKDTELTNTTRLNEFTEKAGVNVEAFNTCRNSDEMVAAVNEDFVNATAIGANGTPHTVVMIGDQQFIIRGAESYADVKNIIEQLLAQLDGVEILESEEG